jgi:hypothetical protein
MRRRVSLLLIASLIAMPVAGCASARGPRLADGVLPDGRPETSNWSRVGEVPAGSEVFVTIKDAQTSRRHVVLADNSSLIVLNLTGSTLPSAVTSALRRLAAERPSPFAALDKTGALAQGDVRIGRDGVFLADRKVAELAQVVQRVARSDVSEIQGPVVARGSVAGGLLGGWLGFAVGVVPALGGAPEGAAWLASIGSISAGAYLGWRWSNHDTDGVIYRAP